MFSEVKPSELASMNDHPETPPNPHPTILRKISQLRIASIKWQRMTSLKTSSMSLLKMTNKLQMISLKKMKRMRKPSTVCQITLQCNKMNIMFSEVKPSALTSMNHYLETPKNSHPTIPMKVTQLMTASFKWQRIASLKPSSMTLIKMTNKLQMISPKKMKRMRKLSTVCWIILQNNKMNIMFSEVNLNTLALMNDHPEALKSPHLTNQMIKVKINLTCQIHQMGVSAILQLIKNPSGVVIRKPEALCTKKVMLLVKIRQWEGTHFIRRGSKLRLNLGTKN